MESAKVYHPAVNNEDSVEVSQTLIQLAFDLERVDCVTIEDTTEAGVRVVTVKTWGVGA